MKVFAVFGVSRTGKTTTAEMIIQELRRRKRSVGSIKDIHAESFAIDTPGTNTFRHKEAGAQMVIARGLRETDILLQRRLSLEEMLKFFHHDFVVIEGCNEEPLPKILTAKSFREVDERLDSWVFAISGVISNDIASGDTSDDRRGRDYKGVPVLNARTDAAALVDLIENKALDLRSSRFEV